MILSDIPVGSTIFVDGNVFVYYFMPHPTLGPPCADLMERIENHDLIARARASQRLPLPPSWRIA
jgi:hypothetical protein